MTPATHFNALNLLQGERQPAPVNPLAMQMQQPREPVTTPHGYFASRLAQAESGGRYDITNTLGYMGKYQFGDARLADYTAATGINPLADGEFSPAEQEAAFDWHLNDIDAAINALGPVDFSRDGLRAVAHLGGIGGMRRFVRDGYSPSDAYGTSLRDYYRRFANG